MAEEEKNMYEEQEEYEMSILDRISDRLIDLLAAFITLFKKDWRRRNQSKLKEWKLMAYSLNRSPSAILGLVIVVIYIIIGIIGPYIAPWQYNFFPVMYNSTSKLAPPGSSVFLNVTTVKNWHVFHYTTTVHYTLGSDIMGRDLVSILLAGARTALVLDIFIIAIGPTVGIILGLISGYYGGKVDELIMRITDVFLAFPGLVLAIALSAVLPGRIQSFLNAHYWAQEFVLKLFALQPRDVDNLGKLLSVFVALIIVWWPGYARVTRGSTLTEKENLYVEAARAIGLPTRTILFKHILPNIIGPLLVMITMGFGSVILTEAGLSFLGLGAVPPIPDWGNLINQGAQYFPQAWWLVAFPGAVIVTVVLGWNLLGDGIRDVLDPRTRRSMEFKLKKKADKDGGESNA